MIAYATAMVLILIGSYALLAKENLIKKIIGLTIFIDGIHLFLISLGYRAGGIAPIMQNLDFRYFSQLAVDPLPQALVLTSIVIDFSVTVLALSLVIQVHKKFTTINSKNLRGLSG